MDRKIIPMQRRRIPEEKSDDVTPGYSGNNTSRILVGYTLLWTSHHLDVIDGLNGMIQQIEHADNDIALSAAPGNNPQ